MAAKSLENTLMKYSKLLIKKGGKEESETQSSCQESSDHLERILRGNKVNRYIH